MAALLALYTHFYSGSSLSLHKQLRWHTEFQGLLAIHQLWRGKLLYIQVFALQFFTLSIYKYYVMMSSGVNSLS